MSSQYEIHQYSISVMIYYHIPDLCSKKQYQADQEHPKNYTEMLYSHPSYIYISGQTDVVHSSRFSCILYILCSNFFCFHMKYVDATTTARTVNKSLSNCIYNSMKLRPRNLYLFSIYINYHSITNICG